jgi:hypothetical protein
MRDLPSDYLNSNNKEMSSVVVATGENEFGSFISAGYLLPTSSEMIMGRRYLDARDQRKKLTIEELYQRVMDNYHGTYCLGSYEMWSNSRAQLRHAPWRSFDLHADCLIQRSGKRKRNDEGRDCLEALTALYIPTDGFSSDLTIVTSSKADDGNAGTNRVASRVRWLEQCNGCGHEIGDPAKACCKEVMEYNCNREMERNSDVGWTFYCSEECAQKYGAQAWADAGRKWARDKAGCSGYFLKSNGASGFWYAVQNDRAAMEILRDAGWRKDFMDYILDAPSLEGETIQYDD